MKLYKENILKFQIGEIEYICEKIKSYKIFKNVKGR